MDSTNLPAGWLDVFDDGYPAPYLELVYDPPGQNIVFSDTRGVISIAEMGCAAEIDPKFAKELTLIDIEITFADPDEYFRAFSNRVDRPFKQITRILDEDTTNNPVTLRNGVGDFLTGDEVVFTDGVNSESITLTSATSSEIGWAGSLVNEYAAGAMVGTVPMTGHEIDVYLKLRDVAGSLLIYKGIVTEPFSNESGKASIKLQNYLRSLFNQNISLHASSYNPTNLLYPSHVETSSFSWNAGAVTELSGITTYAGCLVGEWNIKIGDHGDTFLVTDPDGVQKIGYTLYDFYDNTSAADSQILIAAADWVTPTEGDELTFYVSANFYDMTIPEILAELLEDYGGVTADIGGAGINDPTVKNTFNVAQSILTTTYSMSIYKKQSLIQAIMAVGVHALVSVVQMRDGSIGIIALNPNFYCNAFTPSLVGDPLIEKFQVVNNVKINYNFDYATEENQNFVVYPGKGANISSMFYNLVADVELNCPAINN